MDNNRILPSRRNSSFIISLIIFLNVAVFLMWIFSGTANGESDFMINHFLISWDSLMEGRIWTLITAAFSHNMFWHLLLNMFVLKSFGPFMLETMGAGRFLKFYLTAAIVSSLCHAVVSAFLLGVPGLPALGASGAISGVILLFSLMFPTQKILIMGLVPIPALWGALLFIGLDVWGLVAQAGGGGLPIGHGAHLGGALTGIVFYFLYFRRKRFTLT